MSITPVKIHFEQEPCGRCGGTGRHSFNLRDGHTCWGCSGEKVRLSRRGRAAFEAYEKALADSAATVAVRDIEPGMRIRSQAHGGLDGAARPWNYKAAWRTVATVEVTEYTGRGVEDGKYVDVPCVRAAITFEDGKTWTSESSDHPAYWAKGAFHTIHTIRAHAVGGPEAQATREEVRRAIAARRVGAWLEGEEPPAPPVRKPRKPKTEEPKPAPAPKPLPANLYPGDCRNCGTLVEAGKGERERVDGRWEVQHKDGECQERPAAEESRQPAQETPQREEHPAMPNKFGGRCADCDVWVEAGKGVRVNSLGRWITRHKSGECATDTTVKVTEEGLYRVPGDGILGEGVFRVRRSERSGRLYAETFTPHTKQGGGARFLYDPTAVYRLEPAHRMTADQAADIGRQLHTCMQCGEHLTDPRSVARGIGPVCAKKV